MEWPSQLASGKFLRRYKRFFADIETSAGPLTVHVPNTGSLKSCLFEGSECVYLPSTDPNRKLKGTLMFVKTPTSWVGVNTALPNQLVHDLWSQKILPTRGRYQFAKREVKISKETRFDMAMAATEQDFLNQTGVHYIEVKNVTLAEDGRALFPDAVTTRGQKHLRELMRLREQGAITEIVFVIQREDCEVFSTADHIDPEYGKLLREAIKKGVRVNAFSCKISPMNGIDIVARPVELAL
jgi:sugar fermentation stimulation protein A